VEEPESPKPPAQTEKIEPPKEPEAQLDQAKLELEAFPQGAPPPRRRSVAEVLATNLVVVVIALIASIVGILLAPVALWGNPSPSIEPEIRAASDAYPSSFTITNKSGWYEITDLEAMCQQGKVDYGDPRKNVGGNYFFRSFKLGTAIAPGGHATFPCLGIPNLGPATSGTIDLVIAYHIRWHSFIIGRPHIIKATETYSQGKWIDGPII